MVACGGRADRKGHVYGEDRSDGAAELGYLGGSIGDDEGCGGRGGRRGSNGHLSDGCRQSCYGCSRSGASGGLLSFFVSGGFFFPGKFVELFLGGAVVFFWGRRRGGFFGLLGGFDFWGVERNTAICDFKSLGKSFQDKHE